MLAVSGVTCIAHYLFTIMGDIDCTLISFAGDLVGQNTSKTDLKPVRRFDCSLKFGATNHRA